MSLITFGILYNLSLKCRKWYFSDSRFQNVRICFPSTFLMLPLPQKVGSSIFFRSMTPGSNYMCFRYFFHLDLRPVFHQAIFFARSDMLLSKLNRFLIFSNRGLIRQKKKSLRAKIVPQWQTDLRHATIHRYIGASQYFFARYEYRYLEQDIDICDTFTY